MSKSYYFNENRGKRLKKNCKKNEIFDEKKGDCIKNPCKKDEFYDSNKGDCQKLGTKYPNPNLYWSIEEKKCLPKKKCKEKEEYFNIYLQRCMRKKECQPNQYFNETIQNV